MRLLWPTMFDSDGAVLRARVGSSITFPPAKFIPATERDFFLFTCEISFPEEFPLKFAARSAENLSWIPLFKADHGS